MFSKIIKKAFCLRKDQNQSVFKTNRIDLFMQKDFFLTDFIPNTSLTKKAGYVDGINETEPAALLLRSLKVITMRLYFIIIQIL